MNETTNTKAEALLRLYGENAKQLAEAFRTAPERQAFSDRRLALKIAGAFLLFWTWVYVIGITFFRQ